MRRPRFRLPPFTMRDVQMPLAGQTVGWGLDTLNVIALHAAGHQGEGVIIVYVDTGVDDTHPDLQGAIIDARDFTGSPIGGRDRQKHGTHTFGTGLARDNQTGILGVAPKALGIMGKGLGDDGSGDGSMVSNAIRWGCDLALTRSKAVILSMSLGSNFDDPEIDDALRYVIGKGVIPVLAAGNDGGVPGVDQVGFPARLDLCPAIASFRRDGQISDFSSQGPSVDCAAPGESIISTVPGGYMSMSGTSMATPFAAGVLALYLGAMLKLSKPLPNAGTATTLIYNNVDDKGPPGRDWAYGYGSINPTKLLAAATKPLPAPWVPPVPPPVPAAMPNSLKSILPWLRLMWKVTTPSVAGEWLSIGPKHL